MINKLKYVLNQFEIDGAIAFTIIGRLVQAGGGVLSIVFIAKFLSPVEQGYYYTFASILAIQVFFELGLSGIITQYTAYEFAHLKWGKKFELIGEENYRSRLSSLLRLCVKWFGIISVVLFFILLIVGIYFFSRYNALSNVEWQKPWIILCLATSMNLFIDPILAFFDGLGEIKDMAKVRLVQKSLNVILLFIFFSLGFKLYSNALASVVSIFFNYIQVIFTKKRFSLLKTIWFSNGKWVINYYEEIFPYQWRIALSWISGYFIFQLFNPILFATEGAVVAGQMGMTLQALNGVSSISMSWISTKVPTFSNFIAKKDYISLDNTFNNALSGLLKVNITLLLIFNLGVFFLKWQHLMFADRFLPLLPTVILSGICFINQLVFSWATYLRCHKSEPFLLQSIVFAVLISLSTILFGRQYGVMGIVYGYGFLTVFVSLIWSYFLFTTKKKLWH
ncbi:MAG: hypothetical protein JWQ34_530 [Mucilaginibacter sp.]|uniref:hypothetical protein n=1 Tax=Mucilaginibacter sp. TaxID=1882438 RepID=UPI00262089DB|nr:hypothetical protein [Mucilaginibacter sp.]MDB5002305.1 hypothetical protein [Mucilaginibacter sp.]